MKKASVAIKDLEMHVKKLPSLKNEYIKALKDEYFKKVISKIDMPEVELMKYTSKFEECASELKNCHDCKNLFECRNAVEGFIFTPSKESNNIIFSYVACKHKQKQLKDNYYQDNVYVIEVPKEIRNASMINIYRRDTKRAEVLCWLDDYYKDYIQGNIGKGLYLSGNFGCGKTYLIAALFNELAKKKIRSAIIYWPEYLRDLKASFTENFTEKFEYIEKVPLLLIDDIGAENTTAWSRDEILGPILQYRMQEELPTFFTSNLNIEDLEQHFSIYNGNTEVVKARRIIERINQLADCMEMISKNRRE